MTIEKTHLPYHGCEYLSRECGTKGLLRLTKFNLCIGISTSSYNGNKRKSWDLLCVMLHIKTSVVKM